MARTHGVTVRLTVDEAEWLRRKAYWEGKSMAELLRDHLYFLIQEEGYLRPPEEEPQDFGYEKEMMQFVLRIQNQE